LAQTNQFFFLNGAVPWSPGRAAVELAKEYQPARGVGVGEPRQEDPPE
jgi:hypothetical protein